MPLVINFQPINQRICTLRIKGNQHNFILIPKQGSAEDKEEEIKNKFHDHLEEIINSLPKQYMRFIVEDFNAKLTREQILEHSLRQQSNTNSQRFRKFGSDQ